MKLSPYKRAFLFLSLGFWLTLTLSQLPVQAQEALKKNNFNFEQISLLKVNIPPQKEGLEVFVTAYSSTVDQTDSDPFITASNKMVRSGLIAANFLPFGTQVMFPEIFGDQVFVVEDRMHSRYQQTVDIWMPTRQKAENFGILKTKMIIL